ncbi:MAG TPA: hypothetical protein VHY09_11130 [Candidatus Methylacidiphilales bacterium]|nr:hypothetical protein [Candidatus Methylacidiphilales bacterium]
MKYIVSPNPNEPGIWYGRYLEYLKTIKGSLPAHIYEFASDERYFTLNSPHSLHDSWLDSVEVLESRNPNRPFEPRCAITLKLLGQLHDRRIILEYEGVNFYDLSGRRNPFNWADTLHGDIFTHEVRVEKEGLLTHEIGFVSESTFLIECRNFTCREEMLGRGGASKHDL